MAAGSSATNPRFFKDATRLRAWLERHHATHTELWVGLYKRGTGRPSITWPELVDQLLCFGWIDGVRKSVDAASYASRVTPRRPRSNWSAVNQRRMQELIALGLVHPAGLSVYEQRDAERDTQYSFPREGVVLPAEYVKRFRTQPEAWTYFAGETPSYRRAVTWWVTSARREETRQRRLATLIADSAAGRRIALLRRRP